MKCSHCGKDYEEGAESAYQSGLQDGEKRLKRTINKVLKNNNTILHANQHLARELLNLDNLLPLEGTPSIIIPLKRAKSILGILPKNHSTTKYLQKLIGEQMSLKS